MSTIRLFITDGVGAARLELTSNVPFYQLRGLQGSWDQVKPFSRLIPAAAGHFWYEDGFLHLDHNDERPIVTIPFPWGRGMEPGVVGVGYLALEGPVLTTPGSIPRGPKVACKVLEAKYDWANTWVGLGIKGGVQVVVPTQGGGRKEGIIGFMVNTHAQQLAFVLVEAHLKKGGWNAGGGGSATHSVLLATGVETAQQLTGTPTGGWDVNISIGLAWSKFFTCLSKARNYSRLAGIFPQVLPKVEQIGMLGKQAAGSEEYLTWSKSFVVGSGVDPTSKSLSVWDTPIGAGLEISCAETEGSIYYSADIFDLKVIQSYCNDFAAARR
jgi:hypothetical protein